MLHFQCLAVVHLDCQADICLVQPIPSEWQIPDDTYKSQYIDTFTAFVNVIYDRYADFLSMGHVRGVFRMCNFYGALSRFSEYMNFRFLEEHGPLLSTLDKDPIGNLNMAEAIEHRVLYSECFTLLAGRVAQGHHQNLIGLNTVVSIHTQRQLATAHRRIIEKHKSMDAKVCRLIVEYKTLLFYDGDVLPDPVLDRYSDLRNRMQQNRHRSPEDYEELRELVDGIGETQVFQESASEDLQTELLTCKCEIDELLENRLLYHPTRRVNFFACLKMSEYPWLLDP